MDRLKLNRPNQGFVPLWELNGVSRRSRRFSFRFGMLEVGMGFTQGKLLEVSLLPGGRSKIPEAEFWKRFGLNGLSRI
jgi:hypothetical protein